MQLTRDECLRSFWFNMDDRQLQLYLQNFKQSGEYLTPRRMGRIISNVHNSKRFLETHEDVLIMNPSHNALNDPNKVYTWCMQNLSNKWGRLNPSDYFWFKDDNDAALFRLMWSS